MGLANILVFAKEGCVRLIGSKPGNEDGGINSLCKQHLQGLQSPIEVFTHQGGKIKGGGKSQTGNAMKGDESRSIKRETFGLKSSSFKIMGFLPWPLSPESNLGYYRRSGPLGVIAPDSSHTEV